MKISDLIEKILLTGMIIPILTSYSNQGRNNDYLRKVV